MTVKPSSLTQVRTRPVRVRTLPGAKCESKGRPGLIVLAAGQSLGVQHWSYPRMDLSYTKGDPR
jgi:hypothetical protein